MRKIEEHFKNNLGFSINEYREWHINIENVSSKVAAEYGYAVVQAIFNRYAATGVHDLSNSYLSDVFADLEQILNDK